MAKKRNTLLAKKRSFAWQTTLPFYLVGAGVAGLIASLSLALEKLAQLADPDRIPLCDINPIMSCGSVMDSAQASLFGVPHSLLGIIAFSGLATFGILLLAGAQFKAWLWQTALFVSFSGVLSIQYLAYESLFRLNALCPWCMVIWIAVMPIFFGINSYVVRNKISVTTNARLKHTLSFIDRHHVTILAVWAIAIIYLIVIQFWYYWSTLL